MTHPEFDIFERESGKVWLHKSKPVWIVFYDAIEGLRLSRYEAYRSVNRVPKGREPWSVDNKALSPHKDGFRTIEEAFAAAVECEAPIHEAA